MRKPTGVSFAASLFALCLAGCAPHSLSPKLVINPNLRVMLEVAPQPVRPLDPATLTVHLADAHHKPVTATTIEIDLSMPSMTMPKNVVLPAARDAGTYVGTGRFTMPGDWQATVTVAKGSDVTVQSFPVSVQ